MWLHPSSPLCDDAVGHLPPALHRLNVFCLVRHMFCVSCTPRPSSLSLCINCTSSVDMFCLHFSPRLPARCASILPALSLSAPNLLIMSARPAPFLQHLPACSDQYDCIYPLAVSPLVSQLFDASHWPDHSDFFLLVSFFLLQLVHYSQAVSTDSMRTKLLPTHLSEQPHALERMRSTCGHQSADQRVADDACTRHHQQLNLARRR